MFATYNQSVKIMFGLARSAHRFLIEPITGAVHLKKTLIRRFLSFIESIKSSKKIALRNLFKVVKQDCRSVTGRNLNMIKNLVGAEDIENLVPSDSDKIEYFVIPQNETWRLSVINEITDSTYGNVWVEGFSRDELKVILKNVCSHFLFYNQITLFLEKILIPYCIFPTFCSCTKRNMILQKHFAS